jgi:hypothetical protein
MAILLPTNTRPGGDKGSFPALPQVELSSILLIAIYYKMTGTRRVISRVGAYQSFTFHGCAGTPTKPSNCIGIPEFTLGYTP